MRFPDQQWAKWPASTMYRMLQHIQKTSLSTEKGEKTLFWKNTDPFLGFPVGSPPEQSFPPLVLLIIEITQNPSHVTLFLESILLFYNKTSRFCALSCLLFFLWRC